MTSNFCLDQALPKKTLQEKSPGNQKGHSFYICTGGSTVAVLITLTKNLSKRNCQHQHRADNQVLAFSPTSLLSCSNSDVPFKLHLTAVGGSEGETFPMLILSNNKAIFSPVFEHSKGNERVSGMPTR
eukprot:4582806-Ditylum_brightwellii.AAC.1